MGCELPQKRANLSAPKWPSDPPNTSLRNDLAPVVRDTSNVDSHVSKMTYWRVYLVNVQVFTAFRETWMWCVFCFYEDTLRGGSLAQPLAGVFIHSGSA